MQYGQYSQHIQHGSAGSKADQKFIQYFLSGHPAAFCTADNQHNYECHEQERDSYCDNKSSPLSPESSGAWWLPEETVSHRTAFPSSPAPQIMTRSKQCDPCTGGTICHIAFPHHMSQYTNLLCWGYAESAFPHAHLSSPELQYTQ